MSALILLAAAVVTAPVRDPFWPVGYEGERHVISAEPRVVPEEPKAEPVAPVGATGVAEKAADPAEEWARRAEEARIQLEMDRRWTAAAKKLKFGGVVKTAGGASSVLINGRARTEGDYVRLNHDGYRFIWRVARNATELKLKLERAKAVRLEEIKGKKN